MDYFLEVRQCKYCKVYFREMTNLGSWQCKYHPDLINWELNEYRCCNKKYVPPHLSDEYMKISPYACTRRAPKRQNVRPQVEGCKRRDHVFNGMKQFTADEFSELDKELICAMDQCLGLNSRPGFQNFDGNYICRQEI